MTQPGPEGRVRNPFLQPRPAAPAARPATPVGPATAMALGLNALTLVGLLVWNWPPGNVYLLFWVENAVLGLVTLPRVATARGTGRPGSARSNGQPASPAALALFFTFHYGLFCMVHLVFTAIVAYRAGFELSLWLLGLPAILIAVRYTVETGLTWFGPSGQRWHVTPGEAMFQPYPRIVVLHVAVLLTFGLGWPSATGEQGVGTWDRIVGGLVPLLPQSLRDPGVLAVLILVAVKTVVDVVTTRRSVRR